MLVPYCQRMRHECVRTVQRSDDVTGRNDDVLQSDWTATIVAERTGR